MAEIDILLSTWNGEKYLEEQLESILKQTFPAWKLLIRDDGSSDGTRETIRRYAEKYPEKIILSEDGSGNLKSTKSFEKLLRLSDAPYCMFCDQDDVWFPDKVSSTFELMRKTEEEHPGTPVAVFTDLTVTDSELHVIAESFERSQKMFPKAAQEVHRCLAHSVAAGCSMMLNRGAVEKVLPMPAHQTHDHWCISIVSACGNVAYLDRPTMYYRQHGKNVVGSKTVSGSYLLRRLLSPVEQIKAFRRLKKAFPYPVNSAKWIYFMLYYSLKRLRKRKA